MDGKLNFEGYLYKVCLAECCWYTIFEKPINEEEYVNEVKKARILSDVTKEEIIWDFKEKRVLNLSVIPISYSLVDHVNLYNVLSDLSGRKVRISVEVLD